MSVGNLVTFTGLIWMINVPMRNREHMNDLKIIAGTIKIREMLMVQPEIRLKNGKVDYVEGKVEFSNVSFAFPDDPQVWFLMIFPLK